MMRCWSPADARVLRSCLGDNDQHLRPWIPFMKDEPRSLEQTAEWLRSIRANFDLRQNYRYAVFDAGEEKLLGENMLLGRVGPGAFEIGYWTDRHATGRGFASEATAAMIRVAFEIERAERLEIHCEPENVASAAIPARLGFTHDATLPKRATNSEGKICDLMVWSLFAADYPATPAAKTALRAFDCLGQPIAIES
ncbi:MAG: GNAT family N-acetyltransferase [Xanthomonadales bacterium]|nr:GNAT family N-acetyltransferase [Gammaproteobacteria bacterium]MBT8054036.1 GNAT family N-acetyltransferase [Gammaproteobacteria bacterium]NND57433.1 GNAT family N-acetyltransferase [Xanthomonadales bacterium]NNK50362.1 GNAT family N-acetyltransferase [Xanthomonadales bacterium]